MAEKIERSTSPEGRESEPKYVLAITESTDNEGTRRTYLPVLAGKAQEYYKESQCQLTQIEGSLADVLSKAEDMAKEDKEGGHYVSVGVETPEERASRRPVDREYVLP